MPELRKKIVSFLQFILLFGKLQSLKILLLMRTNVLKYKIFLIYPPPPLKIHLELKSLKEAIHSNNEQNNPL